MTEALAQYEFGFNPSAWKPTPGTMGTCAAMRSPYKREVDDFLIKTKSDLQPGSTKAGP